MLPHYTRHHISKATRAVWRAGTGLEQLLLELALALELRLLAQPLALDHEPVLLGLRVMRRADERVSGAPSLSSSRAVAHGLRIRALTAAIE